MGDFMGYCSEQRKQEEGRLNPFGWEPQLLSQDTHPKPGSPTYV